MAGVHLQDCTSCFHSFNPQVGCTLINLMRIPGTYSVHTSTCTVYEVNQWLWQFGRGKPCLGGLTIEETSDRQDAARKASDKRRKETREGRKVS